MDLEHAARKFNQKKWLASDASPSNSSQRGLLSLRPHGEIINAVTVLGLFWTQLDGCFY